MKVSSMKLNDLLFDVNVIESDVIEELEIEDVSSDSRRCKENSLFVAIKGLHRNGNNHINSAIKNGAVAIVTDERNVAKLPVPVVLVDSSRHALARICSNYYNKPSKKMKIIAITGTNGKTSTSYFLYNILRTAGKNVGLITTIECIANNEIIDISGGGILPDIESAMTTPDAEILHKIFSIMREKEVEYVIMEASSQGIEMGRLEGIDFEVGMFTNLSHEHLDFHGNIENYYKSKRKLFENTKINIVNIDDEYGKRLCSEKESYSISLTKGDFVAKNIKLGKDNMQYEINGNIVNLKMSGEYNVYNSLMAYACGEILGVPLNNILNGLKNTTVIRGRLERILNKDIYIDYAHTPEAVKRVLNTIRSIHPDKRIMTLFGCGGDRDKRKRALIGEICSNLSDMCIITSDNARNENPLSIINDIVAGINKEKPHIIIPDREDAIRYVVSMLTDSDALVLLGKGHENYEIINDYKRYFNEREIIEKTLNGKN